MLSSFVVQKIFVIYSQCNNCVLSADIHFLYVLFHFDFSELQLKLVHQPVKIIKKWKDLLIQYTNASKEDCQGGWSVW